MRYCLLLLLLFSTQLVAAKSCDVWFYSLVSELITIKKIPDSQVEFLQPKQVIVFENIHHKQHFSLFDQELEVFDSTDCKVTFYAIKKLVNQDGLTVINIEETSREQMLQDLPVLKAL